jgi:hypothetical protein
MQGLPLPTGMLAWVAEEGNVHVGIGRGRIVSPSSQQRASLAKGRGAPRPFSARMQRFSHEPRSSNGRVTEPAEPPAVALVLHEDERLSLAEGESLSVGRQSGCDLRIGSVDRGPEDLGVSRRAATISHAQGRLWVRNDSTTLPVYVRPSLGQECVLERRGDMVSFAEPVVDVALEGQIKLYRIRIELPFAAGVTADAGPATVAPATRSRLPLTDRERRLLVALCEPLLRGAARAARPASYKEVAERVGLSDHTVRNALDALRERLIAIGIPGMVGPDAKDNLARYAVRSGSVTPADLKVLD